MGIKVNKKDLDARQAMEVANEFCKTWEIDNTGVAFFNQTAREFSYLIRTDLGYFWTFITGVEHNKMSASAVHKLINSIHEKAPTLTATTVGSVKVAGLAKFVDLSVKGMKRKLVYIPEGEKSKDGVDTKDLYEAHKVLMAGAMGYNTMDCILGAHTEKSMEPEAKTHLVLGEVLTDKSGNATYRVVSTSDRYAWAVKKKVHTGATSHLSVRCYSLPLGTDPNFPTSVLPYLKDKGEYASIHVEVTNNTEIAQMLGAVTAATNCVLNLHELGQAIQ